MKIKNGANDIGNQDTNDISITGNNIGIHITNGIRNTGRGHHIFLSKISELFPSSDFGYKLYIRHIFNGIE